MGSPSVNNGSPAAGASFTLSATVRNAGDDAAAATTLRYYRSTDGTMTTSDTSVGTDAVGGLAAGATSSESIDLTAPSMAGTYYYGACVDAVTDESNTANNCSSAVSVTVSAPPPPHGGQPATEVHLFRPARVSEGVGEHSLFVAAWTTGDHAPTESIPVRVWLVAGTADAGVDFDHFTQSVEFNAADFTLNGSEYEALKEFTFTILDDTLRSSNETPGGACRGPIRRSVASS